MGSFSVVGRRDHHEGALQRCSAEAVGSSIQLPSHEAGQVMKGRSHKWVICLQDSPVLISACMLLCVLSVWFVSTVIKSLTPHYIHSICSKCSHAWTVWFGNILSISSALFTHDVTTYASCVTMQMRAHVCIFGKLIWIFFEFNITLPLTISVEVGLIYLFP